MKVRVSAGMGLLAVLPAGTALAQTYDGSGSPTFIPHTLQEALASAYLTNPQLQEERARLRAADEQIPTALAGWRPTIQGQASVTYYDGSNQYATQGYVPGPNNSVAPAVTQQFSTPGYTGQVSIQQPLYQGGKTTSQTHQAKNSIMAERAQLIATEQDVFTRVVEAYVGVVTDQQLLQININNEHVLEEQVKATEERFRLGEITRTDVAQARAALALASANRQQAEGTLQTAQATYLQVVGLPAAPNLQAAQPLNLPVKSEQEVASQATQNNPAVINALFTESARKDGVGVAISAILPKVSAEAAFQHMHNQGYGRYTNDYKYAMLNFTVPIYQGGSEYSAVRLARQQALGAHRAVDEQRRAALQRGISNWQQLNSYRAALASNRAAVAANVIALDGVERQAIVGTSTTLEVLQQQQTLLQSQTALIQGLSNLVQSSYGVAAAIGRLTARDLKLDVPLYDEKAYYNAVKDKLWGISDYAVNQPGR